MRLPVQLARQVREPAAQRHLRRRLDHRLALVQRRVQAGAVLGQQFDELLTKHFHTIQAAAGIDLACRVTNRTGAELKDNPRGVSGGNACTTACHRYGFHDLRRAFATMNAANMSRESLQALMRHQSSLTTERYINFARQIKPAVANLHVPKVG